MNSITATYPGFQSLPKGIKQMLVVSESVFFEDARAARAQGSHRQLESTYAGSGKSSPQIPLPLENPAAIDPWPLSATGLPKTGMEAALQ